MHSTAACPPGFVTHASQENHFQICVPPGWLAKDAPAAQFMFMPTRPLAEFGGMQDSGFTVGAQLIQKTIPAEYSTMDAVFQAEWYIIATSTPDVRLARPRSPVTIAGMTGHSFEITFILPNGLKVQQEIIQLFSPLSRKLYGFGLTAPSLSFEKYRPSFEQMAATLQMI